MVKHTQTIRWKFPTNWLSVFDHFVKLVLKGSRQIEWRLQNGPITKIGVLPVTT